MHQGMNGSSKSNLPNKTIRILFGVSARINLSTPRQKNVVVFGEKQRVLPHPHMGLCNYDCIGSCDFEGDLVCAKHFLPNK